MLMKAFIESQGYVTRIVLPRGEFHPWVEFAPVCDQTYLSVYMFNRGEISSLPLFHPAVTRHDFKV